ncbi:MAG TPA: Mur ligase family protein [Candidatus Dormibacteraeota bacterium]|nr:Mur ligase family protein [Candidatus Dormibacteraeota bacterium]
MEIPAPAAAATSPGPSGHAALRVPARLAELGQSRIDLVGVASVEGGEMARYLLASGFTNLVGHDQQPDLESLRRSHHLAHAGMDRDARHQRLEELLTGLRSLQLGGDYLKGIETSALIIPTQAWFLAAANAPLQQLKERGHPFYSLIQAYLDLARGEVVGVTGTHGKSTTSSLVAALVAQSGLYPKVWLAGNDRHDRQALVEVAGDDGTGCLVLEISNRQLLQMERAPRVGCLTNITPNHLDEHQGLAGYVAAKRRIFELPGCEVAIRNGDDPQSLAGGDLRPEVRQLRFARGLEQLAGLDGAFEEEGLLRLRWQGTSHAVMAAASVPLVGRHNLSNVRAALTVLAVLAPLEPDQLAKAAQAVESFRPLRHRTELVRQHRGVDYVDDLSSTTPQSTVAAVMGLGRPCILIAGGEDKGIDFSELSKMVGASVGRLLLLPGKGSDRLAQEVSTAGHEDLVSRLGTLQEAVSLATELAQPGDTILLSPACPGFFTAHYRQGGFRQAVRAATSPRPRMGPE